MGHFRHLAAPRNWKASRNLSCMKIPNFSKNFGLGWVGLGFLRWRGFFGRGGEALVGWFAWFFFPIMLLRLLAVGGGFFRTEINNHLSVLLVKLPL